MKYGLVLVVLAPLLALLLASCGSDGSAAVEEPAPITTEDAGLVVGDKATTTKDGNTLTVLSYESPLPPAGDSKPDAGFELSAIEVEGCASRTSGQGLMHVGSNAFVLELADGARIRPQTFTDEDAKVKEPVLRSMDPRPGGCERGFVVFQTPEGERPELVIFEEQFTTEPQPIEWTIPDA